METKTAQPNEDQEERAKWLDAETERRSIEEDSIDEVELEPLENFPPKTGWFRTNEDRPPRRRPGKPCAALNAVIAGSCNGWRSKPTAVEAEQAIKDRKRGSWQDAIAWTIATESSIVLIVEAEEDGAYSLQDLAWWIRELRIPAYKRIRWLNAMSRGWTAEQKHAPEAIT